MRKSARVTADLLREFVYLDEVSVYSLIASKDGMIAAEVTDAVASSLQAELSSSVSGSAGIAKGEIGANLRTSETQSTQVLRKAIVQSTFRDLHARTREALSIRPPGADAKPPELAGSEGLSTTVDCEWIIDPTALTRGKLVEINVVLETEPLFQARTMISVVFEMIQGQLPFIGQLDLDSLGQAASGSVMLDKLLAGLVPLRCRALDYVVVKDGDGREWVVHRDVCKPFPNLDQEPLYLVGVAEQALFWRDIRRVVFSESSYTILARIGRDSLQSSWTPLKLVDVVGRVSPDLERSVEELNRTAMSTIGTSHGGVAPSPGARSGDPLWRYAELLSEAVGVEVSRQEFEESDVSNTASNLGLNADIDQWRSAFKPITNYIQSLALEQIDPAVASQCRLQALGESGQSSVVASALPGRAVEGASQPAERAERLLDAEIIAIYW